MKLLLFGILALCGVYADEVTVQINVNKPLNVISDRFISFSVDPRVIIDNLNRNNSEKLNMFASEMNGAYLKLSTVPLPTIMRNCEVSPSLHEEELKNWKMLHEWLRSVDWTPEVPLPYDPTDWESVAVLRILNASSTTGVENCVWQLGSDFDAIGAAAYVGDLITLQTMVDAFKIDGWRVIGADISAGSDPEETKIYSDLTKHIVTAIGWMQPSEKYIPETQNTIVNDNDLALRAILGRRVPVWLSISPNANRRTDNWSGISTADGVQWARTLGDAARTGFDVIYRPLSAEDLFEENLSYFSGLLFKQIMGNKVFDAKVIGGNRFTSHVYCHCTKNKPGALSIMAVNIGDVRSKFVIKTTTKHMGAELWQYILTSTNKTTYLNGDEVYFKSTMEPFIKVKHPSRPINVQLPPMSIGFWVLPLANHKECLEQAEEVDEQKKYMRVRTSSDLLLQHLIEESAISKSKSSPKQEEEVPEIPNNKQNIMKPVSSDFAIKPSRRDKGSKNRNSNDNPKESSRRRRDLGSVEISMATKDYLTKTLSQEQAVRSSKLYRDSGEVDSFRKTKSHPAEDMYLRVVNGPDSSERSYNDVRGYKEIAHSEYAGDAEYNPHIPAVFYEIYNIREGMPKHPVHMNDRSEIVPRNQQNYVSLHQYQNSNHREPEPHYSRMKVRKIAKRAALHRRVRRDIGERNWNRRKRNISRKRRSPAYKAISMTNFISKDMEDGSPPNRKYILYTLNKNFVRPVNFDDIQWEERDAVPEAANTDTNTYSEKNLIGTPYQEENPGNDETRTATENTAEEHTPKFMMFMSENVSKFMKMLNHHVSGWWNTWV